MVFSSLRPADKEAFFDLLDEYFSSRPGAFEATQGRLAAERPPSTSTGTERRSNNAQPPPPTRGGPEPSSSSEISLASAARAVQTGKLVSQKVCNTMCLPTGMRCTDNALQKFGDVDITSGKNMLSSLRHSTANKTAVPPAAAPFIPSAFQKKSTFAPPPVRRVPSSSVEPETLPPVVPAPTKERAGDWAEALYDYESEDPGDLALREHQRVLVLEKTSDDWWTGEMDGQRGLFPASYVKMV
ncbi:hypothetical protein BXZ70DRAFT_744016 [Cristinia sonorae]|uniref:SH3 domain-containing protein n=1 Tax=Cristinia sonorae TaxID=1940300 RepID=A0A8K0UF68_9AGAR|nr:hypothetical protein BXZ70DRAFT_744016 [Cristinia sonorae]